MRVNLSTWRRAVAVAAVVIGAGLGTVALDGAPAFAMPPCSSPEPPSWCDDPTPPPPPPTTRITALARGGATFDWGSDHQSVTAVLYETTSIATGQKINAYVTVTTRTWTTNPLFGFHATSWTDLGPAAWSTAQQRYGVDGTLISVS